MSKYSALFLLFFLNWSFSFAKVYYVSKLGSDINNGNITSPFLTISKAARHAISGDTVIISGGVYREWVSPENGGISEHNRIVYMAKPGEKVFLKGSEVVNDWKRIKDGIWEVAISNDLFGDFNPYDIKVFGDCLQKGFDYHLGEVFVNGEPYFEVLDEKENFNTKGSWFCTLTDDTTRICVNFNDVDPREALTEITVRPACFFPKTTGVNFIEVNGLNVSQAATQWASPTNEQIGIIGPNWSKGWLIHNCDISHSKCVGVCLGKSRASGHNMESLFKQKKDLSYNKQMFNREIETVIKGLDLGWNKENIGSHIVKDNVIHDCGQAGIVGHMGAAFSLISNNMIYNINRTDGRIVGFETAGIKFHGAIDTYIDNNYIKNSTMGLWLDWQAQGTHVCNNVFEKNEKQDMFFEVSHGPTLVYNNICMSDLGLLITAQGIAVFNNLIAGRACAAVSSLRYTPYHIPHSTKLMGLFNNTGGDLRFYNNIFLGNAPKQGKGQNGLIDFDRFPSINEKKVKQTKRLKLSDYLSMSLPVYSSSNLYLNKARPFKGDKKSIIDSLVVIEATLFEKDGKVFLNLPIHESTLKQVNTLKINTEMLGHTLISEAVFENADGTAFSLSYDILKKKRNNTQISIGPFENYLSKMPVWQIQKE